MADMQEIEDTIREHEPSATIAQTWAFDEQFIARQNLFSHRGQAEIVRAQKGKGQSAKSKGRKASAAFSSLPSALCSSRIYHLLFTDSNAGAFSRRKRSDNRAPRSSRSTASACRKRLSQQI